MIRKKESLYLSKGVPIFATFRRNLPLLQQHSSESPLPNYVNTLPYETHDKIMAVKLC